MSGHTACSEEFLSGVWSDTWKNRAHSRPGLKLPFLVGTRANQDARCPSALPSSLLRSRRQARGCRSPFTQTRPGPSVSVSAATTLGLSCFLLRLRRGLRDGSCFLRREAITCCPCHRVLLGGDRGAGFPWLRLHWCFPCGWYRASDPNPSPVGSWVLRLRQQSCPGRILRQKSHPHMPFQRRGRGLLEGCRLDAEGDAEDGARKTLSAPAGKGENFPGTRWDLKNIAEAV